MRRFSRRGPLIKVRLTEYETSLLEQLIDDFAVVFSLNPKQVLVLRDTLLQPKEDA